MTPFSTFPIRANASALPTSPGALALGTLTIAVVAANYAWPAVGRSLEVRTEALAAGQWWRLLTYTFPHNLGWPHAGLNLLGVYLWGTQLERLIGTPRFLLFYLGAAACGMAMFFAVEPPNYGRSGGASIALFAIVGALLVTYMLEGASNDTRRALVVTGGLFAFVGLATIGGVGTRAAPGLPGVAFGIYIHAFGFVPGAAVAALMSADRHHARTPLAATAGVMFLTVTVATAIGAHRWNVKYASGRARDTAIGDSFSSLAQVATPGPKSRGHTERPAS